MKVLLELDKEVERLIRYIPENVCSEILVDLIKQGIYSKSSVIADEEQIKSNSNDINKVIKLIESLASGSIKQPEVKAQAIEIEPEVKRPQISVINVSGLEDDEFDDDMLSMMK